MKQLPLATLYSCLKLIDENDSKTLLLQQQDNSFTSILRGTNCQAAIYCPFI